jgi:hypothetical protein
MIVARMRSARPRQCATRSTRPKRAAIFARRSHAAQHITDE